MKSNPQKTERIHSLDSLRAIMMLLGIVLHASIIYSTYDDATVWSLIDPESKTILNEYIAVFIHVFRMPVFFVIAGFFGSMLFYERKPLAMLKNRVSRILLPFIVFLVILWPLFGFAYTHTSLTFSRSENILQSTLAVFSDPFVFIPTATVHLWFLYYLIIITFTSVGLGFLLKKLPKLTHRISLVFNWIIEKTIVRVLFFAAINVLLFFTLGIDEVATSGSLIPEFNIYIFYTFFYLVGWVLFKSKPLLNTLMQGDWLCTFLGLVLFTIRFMNYSSFSFEGLVLINSFMIWLLIFGITGLFIRYGSNHSPRMRYISDASYWVYLVHYPIVVLIPGLIVDWPIPAFMKFVFVVVSTGIICFGTYHLFVRSTFIGKFLNGRKYSRKLLDIK